MKKVLALMVIALSCSLATMAQGGGGQQMTPEQRKAMMVERLKPLGLNDVQIDSVIAIGNDMRTLMGNVREMTPEQREAKMKEVNDVRTKRMEKALGAELAKKVADATPQRRPGGGGR